MTAWIRSPLPDQYRAVTDDAATAATTVLESEEGCRGQETRPGANSNGTIFK